jgi:hypothetical protein
MNSQFGHQQPGLELSASVTRPTDSNWADLDPVTEVESERSTHAQLVALAEPRRGHPSIAWFHHPSKDQGWSRGSGQKKGHAVAGAGNPPGGPEIPTGAAELAPTGGHTGACGRHRMLIFANRPRRAFVGPCWYGVASRAPGTTRPVIGRRRCVVRSTSLRARTYDPSTLARGSESRL